MADLWLADDHDARAVVLKTIRADLCADTDVRVAFRREIAVTALLHHARVVHHVAHGVWEGQDVLAVEHIRGVSLDHLANGRVPVAPAVSIAIDLSEALAYVHALRGDDGTPLCIVHGDVSPQNVVVDRAGHAHLIDFGAATLRAQAPSAPLIGKPSYMSPEQSGHEIVDARSDQFALGVVLWELIAGRSLFHSAAPRDARTIEPLSSFADVPPHVEACVFRMLAPDRDARFPDMRTVAEVLRMSLAVDADARAWIARTVRHPHTPSIHVRSGPQAGDVTRPMRRPRFARQDRALPSHARVVSVISAPPIQ